MRVLVVSERADVRQQAATALALRDAEVTEATTSREARQQVIDGTFDVLVIDGDMSPKGGFSLLYELREGGDLRGESTPPALVLLAREEDRWLAGWAGANEVLIKPADPFRLVKVVADLAGAAAPPAGARASGEQVDALLDEADSESSEGAPNR
ncbi:MAG: response regulator [Nitriliruptorales bacterium]|nr:response regulator [Nitriliruptorales bacterium]